MGLRSEGRGSLGGLIELASGVDALYMSGRASLSERLLAHLDQQRSLAADTGNPIPLRLGGIDYGMAGHGFGKYRYCLLHPNGQMGLTSSRSLPAVRVQPRAEFLHGVGPEAALGWFEEAVGAIVGPVRFTVSRLDLHADWQGWALDGDDRHRFVCQADRRDLHEKGEALTGFEFGRRTTKTLCARIYDKSAEVEAKGNDYWKDLWGNRYEESKPVLRVEFEFGREGLRQYEIDTPREALDAKGALWASATTKWLSYRSPTADATRARWPVAPEWQAVQRATLRGDAGGLDRIAEGLRRGALRTLMPAVTGYLASVAQILGTTGIDDTCAALPALLEDFEKTSRTSFAYRIGIRRAKAAFQ